MTAIAGNILFEVFSHPDGKRQTAFGQSSEGQWVLVEVAGGDATCTQITAQRMATMLSAKLRAGYQASKAPLYFDACGKKFTFVHPELAWGGTDWILAAEPKSITLGVQAVLSELASVQEGVLSQAELSAWATRQSANTDYLVAFTDHPIWSLALAQVALSNGWVMRANPAMRGDTPSHLPSANPVCWDAWLGQIFREHQIQNARRALGYTFENLMKIDTGSLISEENLSSMI